MRRYLVPVLVFVLLVGVISAHGEVTEEIADNYPFETALELSRILDRQLMFSFLSASCPHCQDFKDNILSDTGVKEILSSHFVLSLVTLDETFKIELPGRGEVTNMQLASGLGLEGTPTTYVFYPPDPELLQEEQGITRFPGNPPDPESLIDLLERIATESFKEQEKGEGPIYYNYSPSIKEISKKDFNFLQETKVKIPVLSEKVGLSSLPDVRELIVNFSDNSLKEYSENIISETSVEKVYLVKD
ncbi:MAG: thioredoxin family protein [Candidatus Bipolaricaulota bacterium]|nr:thioredoxin family protein [Candidatus Bipolaricaulota bacterium]MBS3791910.1 thioredoxin family protein [Candidatus Bipolaricaulota bacterium]